MIAIPGRQRALDHRHVTGPHRLQYRRHKRGGRIGVMTAQVGRQRLMQRRHVRAGAEYQIDPCRHQRGHKLAMQTIGPRAELAHIAENREAQPARAWAYRAEHLEGRAHRSWVGVVAVVDDLERTFGSLDEVTFAAPLRRLEIGERARRRPEVGVENPDDREHGEAVVHPMATRHANAVRNRRAPNRRRDTATIGMKREPQEPHPGRAVLANVDDAAHAAGPGRAGKPRIVGAIEIENGDAAGLDALEDFGLSVGDRLDAVEELEVRGLDVGNHRDVRPHHAGQRRDLSRMVHADLKDRVASRGAACARG